MNVWLKRALRAWFAILFASMAGALAWAVTTRRSFVPVDGPEDDEIHLGAFFGPLEFHGSATSFRGGTVDCGFGGGVVDLSGATLAPEGAELRLHSAFGGGQLLVPMSWNVETHAFALFGGITDTRGNEDGREGPTLTITGWSLFGGYGIQAAGERPDLVVA